MILLVYKTLRRKGESFNKTEESNQKPGVPSVPIVPIKARKEEF